MILDNKIGVSEKKNWLSSNR